MRERPPVDNAPSVGDPADGDPENGDPVDADPSDGTNPWLPDRLCKNAKFTQPTSSFDLKFGPRHNLSFIQDLKRDDDARGKHVRVFGDLTIRRSSGETPGPSVVVDAAANFEGFAPDIRFDPESQALVVKVPRTIPWDETSSRPCLKIQAAVWVPENSVLDTLFVENIHLGINLRDDLSLHVTRGTALTTVVGDVTAAVDGHGRTSPLDGGRPADYELHSRHIVVKSTSADIHGHWPLYDYLRLQSVSGDIRAGIEPKTVDKDDPKPALLRVKSLSGDVEVYQPIERAVSASAPEKHIPPRDYRPDIYTKSGNIKASLPFSRSFRAETTSGRIDLDTLPVLDASSGESGETSSLETSTISGRTIFRARSPLWTKDSTGRYLDPAEQARLQVGRALRSLQSRHTSTSDSIKLHYPAAWEGDLDLASMSGKLAARGEGVRIIKEGSDWPGLNKKLLARKGPGGGSYVTARSTSGDIDVRIE